MNRPHHDSNRPKVPSHADNPSLEELDVLVRQCHHLHDEEVVHAVKKMWHHLKSSIGYQPISALKIICHDRTKA